MPEFTWSHKLICFSEECFLRVEEGWEKRWYVDICAISYALRAMFSSVHESEIVTFAERTQLIYKWRGKKLPSCVDVSWEPCLPWSFFAATRLIYATLIRYFAQPLNYVMCPRKSIQQLNASGVPFGKSLRQYYRIYLKHCLIGMSNVQVISRGESVSLIWNPQVSLFTLQVAQIRLEQSAILSNCWQQ